MSAIHSLIPFIHAKEVLSDCDMDLSRYFELSFDGCVVNIDDDFCYVKWQQDSRSFKKLEKKIMKVFPGQRKYAIPWYLLKNDECYIMHYQSNDGIHVGRVKVLQEAGFDPEFAVLMMDQGVVLKNVTTAVFYHQRRFFVDKWEFPRVLALASPDDRFTAGDLVLVRILGSVSSHSAKVERVHKVSGPESTGVKRHGHGKGNWGTDQDELKGETEPLNETDSEKPKENANSENVVPDLEKEEEKPQNFNVRKVCIEKKLNLVPVKREEEEEKPEDEYFSIVSRFRERRGRGGFDGERRVRGEFDGERRGRGGFDGERRGRGGFNANSGQEGDAPVEFGGFVYRVAVSNKFRFLSDEEDGEPDSVLSKASQIKKQKGPIIKQPTALPVSTAVTKIERPANKENDTTTRNTRGRGQDGNNRGRGDRSHREGGEHRETVDRVHREGGERGHREFNGERRRFDGERRGGFDGERRGFDGERRGRGGFDGERRGRGGFNANSGQEGDAPVEFGEERIEGERRGRGSQGITFTEWKKLQQDDAPNFNVRKVCIDKKLNLVPVKREEEEDKPEDEYVSTQREPRQKRVDIAVNFNTGNARSFGNRGDRRGGRGAHYSGRGGDAGRRGGRGNSFNIANEAFPAL